MDRGAWWSTVHGVAKESDMTEQLTFQCLSFVNGFFFFMMTGLTGDSFFFHVFKNPLTKDTH